ncbi:helix-turn-helix domain-containing protein [Nocardiopsis sp. RSe5-2]|uniref:Helix-turn-helix domain-containing protein n=1 Tax=Nocardiopsis endophytica TaxID=3018445 RepID=A0ABT4U6R6_9ACTN|nr:helix-turn-helix domain-containing protein [Nocardiopsis endophytica]MDA2812164.1 helix-turn-helix domain-containing protein [Nocardiopsis endophytica]
MPGGRLTPEERRRIARGLGDGLSYAGIARGLGRPTSTVTREVMRNGGPNDYRPDRAQKETERRARRGPAAPPRSASRAPGPVDGARRRAEEIVVGPLQATGLPRTPARVMAALFVADAGLTAAELAERLGLSPASVSKIVGYLEEQDLVRRERVPGGRRDLYLADRLAWVRAWEASIRANLRLADAARECARILGPGTPAGARLDEVGAFFAMSSEALLDITARWERETGWWSPVGGEPDAGGGTAAPAGADTGAEAQDPEE